MNTTGVPRCDCGGIIKPDVVLYEECLNDDTVNGAVSAIRQADMLIVAGTSLVVYPAAGLINYYRGINWCSSISSLLPQIAWRIWRSMPKWVKCWGRSRSIGKYRKEKRLGQMPKPFIRQT